MPADAVGIVEMAPRDGLQNESAVLSTADKVELVERAVRAGARRIEVTSFVNPARVPQMADADELMAALPRPDGVSYAGLVMNDRGLDRALAAGVDEVDVVVVATDTFCLRNQGVTTEEACRQAASLVSRAREAGVLTTVTIGAAFGCPFEGEVPEQRLREVLGRVADAGPDELALADTIGVAVPTAVTSRLALALMCPSACTSTTPGTPAWPTPWRPTPRGSAPSTPASAAPAAAHSPRTPPATSPRRTSSTSSTGWA